MADDNDIPKDDPRFPFFKEMMNDFLGKKKAGENPDIFNSFKDFLNINPDDKKVSAEDPRTQQAMDILVELTRDTTDQGVQDATLRALSVYRSIVRHVKAGGRVKFVSTDGTEKTLKVRLSGSDG